ncbi:MAG: alpha/beta fold hydrolase [Candidatus Hodarchaeales archaeon]|jgi:pimeloyl-ACP methyl ester carboxylesterase
MDFESLELTDEVRATLPGSFIQTSDGYVHYQLKGEGECVVFVHGITTPSFVWDPIFDELASHNFSVLRYDLFGRGYSDRIRGRFDVDLYDRQLLELLTKLGLNKKKLTLVGLSLGGAICANFAVRHSELIKSICLIDPVHPSKLPRAMKLLQVPGLNKIIVKFFGRNILFSNMSGNFHNYEKFPQFKDKFMAQLKFKGYSRSVISTMVQYKFDNLDRIYTSIGKLDVPICLFWGEEDTIVPYEVNEKLRTAIPHVIFHSIKEAGHLSHYEKPEIVTPLLLAFLEK